MRNLPDLVCTQDLCEAATYKYAGYKLEAVEKKDPKNVKFCFQRQESSDDFLRAYMADELRIEPKRFFAILRELKQVIHSGQY